MTQSTHNMLKQSLKLAWPIALQNILVTMLSMVDVIMVSHLGNASVAAVGLGNRVQFVIQVILLGIAWAVGVMSAQFHGASQTTRIRQTILMAASLAVAALIPVIVANFYWVDNILAWGSNDQSVINLGQNYLWITIPSMIIIAIIMIFENALRGINQVKIPMLFSSLAIGLNIILNYWLINGGLGISAMGVDGAAWATAIARFFHLSLLLLVLIKIKHILLPRHLDFTGLAANFQPWLKMIKLVLPMMLSFALWSVGTFVYQLIYGNMGTEELAVMSLLTPIEGIILSLFIGLSSACAIIVGQQLGANQFSQAWQTAKLFSIASPIFALAIGVLLLLLQDVIFALFSQIPEQTKSLAEQVFIVIALGSWIKVTCLTLSMGVLRSGGDNQMCMYIDTIGMWFISIPLTYFAAFYLEWPLVWVALTAYSEELTKAIMFIKRTHSKKWLRNLVEPSP